jgi:hypothetical protein
LLAGLLSELSAKFKVASSVPVALGMNAAVTTQLAFAASVPTQLLAC